MKRSALRALGIATPLVVSMIAAACSLQDGGVDVLAANSGDAATSSDVAIGSDAVVSDATALTDASADQTAPPADSGTDSGPPAHFIFATTSTKLYALNVSTYALAPVATFAGCGLPGGYDTVDPAQDSLGRMFFLLHNNANGNFSYYGIHADGGCSDVHGGPGTGPAGSGFWAGYQKVGTTDTLLALANNQSDVVEYNGMGDYMGQSGNFIPNGGATADIACTSALCYTALTASRCPSDSGASDCLFAFQSNGGTPTQIGSFGKSGIVGIAYDEGSVFGFASDGSIIKISTTAPSVGVPITTTGTASAGLVWQGAASSSANL